MKTLEHSNSETPKLRNCRCRANLDTTTKAAHRPAETEREPSPARSASEYTATMELISTFACGRAAASAGGFALPWLVTRWGMSAICPLFAQLRLLKLN